MIIEFDAVLVDPGEVYYEVHKQVAAEVGWSHLDQHAYRRAIRKGGRQANVLRGAAPLKVEKYHVRFEELIEADDLIARFDVTEEVKDAQATLSTFGSCYAVTTGANGAARRRVLEQSRLLHLFADVVALDKDPRRRPGQLRILADNDERTIVAGASDTLMRSAEAADLFTVGLTSGMCSAERLHQAGARIVYRDLCELANSLRGGAEDLIRAGLLPVPLG